MEAHVSRQHGRSARRPELSEEKSMNAVLTKFAVSGDEVLLAGIPPPVEASCASGVENRPRWAEDASPGGLLALAQSLRGSSNEDGLSLAAQLRERYPPGSVVVLLVSEQPDGAIRTAGVKEAERAQVSWPSLAEVNTWHIPPSGPRDSLPSVVGHSAEPAAAFEPEARMPTARSLGLTRRQLEVLALMAQGKPNKLICRELDLAEGTVKCHVSAILRALEVGSRTQAALKATRLGLGVDRGRVDAARP
jgi:DNA-binding NarL/FixJ family response regulator